MRTKQKWGFWLLSLWTWLNAIPNFDSFLEPLWWIWKETCLKICCLTILVSCLFDDCFITYLCFLFLVSCDEGWEKELERNIGCHGRTLGGKSWSIKIVAVMDFEFGLVFFCFPLLHRFGNWKMAKAKGRHRLRIKMTLA